METIRIKQATIHNLSNIQDLFFETISKVCKKDYGPEEIDAWRASIKNTKRWKDAIEQQYFLIAEYHEQIVGFGSLDKGNYIDFLFVHKDHLKRGVAKQLYNALKKRSKELGHIKMTANVSITARPFFEKQGFKVIQKNINNVRGVEIINYHMSE